MPIRKIKWGKHEEVLELVFGSGDICFSGGKDMHSELPNLLIFQQQTPHPIGYESDDNVGKTTDEMEDIRMVMQFDRVESITALIHSLIEVQQQMFNALNSEEHELFKTQIS